MSPGTVVLALGSVGLLFLAGFAPEGIPGFLRYLILMAGGLGLLFVLGMRAPGGT